MTPAKGKSPIDKKPLVDTKNQGFNGSAKNSIEGKILRGDYLLPGLNRKQTISAYRAWQKDFRINGQAMEKWYHQKVQDTNPQGDTS